MSKIIRLPEDSCLTGCKWTPKSGLKTTCQSSPPPEESFTTSAEVSWVTKDLVLEKSDEGRLRTRFSKTDKTDSVEKLSNTSCVFFPQLLVNSFDTAVHFGSWSTRLPESLEARANWREGAWPLTSAHWLIAATVCPTVFCVCVSFCMCVFIYYSIIYYSISHFTPIPQKMCVLWEIIMYFKSHEAPKVAGAKMYEFNRTKLKQEMLRGK